MGLRYALVDMAAICNIPTDGPNEYLPWPSTTYKSLGLEEAAAEKALTEKAVTAEKIYFSKTVEDKYAAEKKAESCKRAAAKWNADNVKLGLEGSGHGIRQHLLQSNPQFKYPYGKGFVSISSSDNGFKLIAGTGSWDFGQYSDGAVLCTKEASNDPNWKKVATRPNFLSIATSSDGLKLAAAMGYGGIHVSKDGGLTWTKTSAPSESIGTGRFHWQRIASSANGSIIFAATGYCTNYGTIYR